MTDTIAPANPSLDSEEKKIERHEYLEGSEALRAKKADEDYKTKKEKARHCK